MTTPKNPHASALGRMARGVPKNITLEERKRRSVAALEMVRVRVERQRAERKAKAKALPKGDDWRQSSFET